MKYLNLDIKFWCIIFILLICIRHSVAFDHTKQMQHAMISSDDDIRTVTTENTALSTTDQSDRLYRWHEHEGYIASDARMLQDNDDDDDEGGQVYDRSDGTSNTKAISQTKNDNWGGYYDFLINEGSYKFWAVFQLTTAALLIYSGFAALYYAKVNPQITEDYDFLLKRRRRFIDPHRQVRDRPFLGFEPQVFQRILDAIAREAH